jgi:hypothetical protein
MQLLLLDQFFNHLISTNPCNIFFFYFAFSRRSGNSTDLNNYGNCLTYTQPGLDRRQENAMLGLLVGQHISYSIGEAGV